MSGIDWKKAEWDAKTREYGFEHVDNPAEASAPKVEERAEVWHPKLGQRLSNRQREILRQRRLAHEELLSDQQKLMNRLKAEASDGQG